MVIISIIILVFFSYRKFQTFRNPVFYFLIIHYLHNFSFSTLQKFGLNIFWRADTSIEFGVMDDIINFNLSIMWIVSLILLFFIKRKDIFINIGKTIYPNKFCLKIYLLFTFFLLFMNIELVLGNIIYGSIQSIDSIGAYDPLARLWNFRIYFLLYYCLFNTISNRKLLILIGIEVLVTFLLSERKDLSLVMFTLLMIYFNTPNLKIRFKQIFAALSVFFLSILIPIYRNFNYENGFFNKLSLSFNYLLDTGDIIIYYITGFANSEGVQNWTLQLLNNGALNHLYGLSYFQAIVNTVIFRPFQPSWLVDSQAAYYFKSVAYPTVTNHGYDFSFTAESILNFGLLGGIIPYFFLAIYIVFLYRKKSKTWILQRFLIWPIILISFRTDSTSMFRLISYVFFVSVIINKINSFYNVRNSRAI